MNEAYVTFETAKLLKEKGFDWDCYSIYGSRNKDFHNHTDRAFNNGGLHTISAPTQQMACGWLREEKGIFIGIYPEFGDVEIAWRHGDYEETLIGYRIKIINLDYCEIKHDFLVKDSYENAIEEGLKYCLT